LVAAQFLYTLPLADGRYLVQDTFTGLFAVSAGNNLQRRNH
jgi:hypothetical protein